MPKDSNEFDQSSALQACRDALNAWRDNRKAFPELTMDLALKLAALRHSHVSNTAFSEALTKAGIVINAQDRAALLKMAEHEPLARKVLAETNRWSPQHIWEQEIKPLLPKPDGAEAEPVLGDAGDTVSEPVAGDGAVLSGFDPAFAQYDPASVLLMFGHTFNDLAAWARFIDGLDDATRAELAAVDASDALRSIADLLDQP